MQFQRIKNLALRKIFNLSNINDVKCFWIYFRLASNVFSLDSLSTSCVHLFINIYIHLYGLEYSKTKLNSGHNSHVKIRYSNLFAYVSLFFVFFPLSVLFAIVTISQYLSEIAVQTGFPTK